MPTIVSLTSCIVKMSVGHCRLLHWPHAIQNTNFVGTQGIFSSAARGTVLQSECRGVPDGTMQQHCHNEQITDYAQTIKFSFMLLTHLHEHGLYQDNENSCRFLPLNNFRSSTSSGSNRPSRMLSKPEERHEIQ